MPASNSNVTISPSAPRTSQSYGKITRKFLMYIILTVQLILTGYPFYWMVVSSFKSRKEYYGKPWGFPEEWLYMNFVDAWKVGIQNYLFNSVYITAISVAALLLVATMAAFYLARRPFKGSILILFLFISGMLIPVHSTLIPLFLIMRDIGLYNSFWALFFPYIGWGLPTAVFLIYGFFITLPKDLEEAATIDGANIFSLFVKIFLPLAKPILATVTVLSAFSIWNDFVMPLVMVSQNALKTLPIGLMQFRGNFQAQYEIISAALVIATAPIIALYLFMQKHITKGIAAGAVKG